MAATKTPPSAWIALICSAVICAAFGLLYVVTGKALDDSLQGIDQVAPSATLPALQAEAAGLRKDIARAQADLAARRRERSLAEDELIRHRTGYFNQQLNSATATVTRERDTIMGQDTALKASPWKVVADRVTVQKAIVDGMAAAAKSEESSRFQPLEAAIDKRRNDMNAILQEINAQDQRFKADQEVLNAKMAALNKEKEQVERQGQDDFGKRATRINQLEDEIRRLLELDLKFVSEILPCGGVLEVAERGDRCIINLTSKDRIVPGMLFLVFAYERGRFVEKGMLEVIRSTGTLSECRVTALVDPKRMPVARGDLIGNPVYNPAKPPVFMFAGEFSEYNREDLAQFVRAAGGVVVDKLQPGVDFLVVRGDANDRSDRERALAREYQILAITERQLLRFVRPAFAPKQ